MSNIDVQYLASHPADGSPARLTLTEDAPKGSVADDGQETAVTIDVEAENYLDLLTGLEALNDEQPRLQFTARWVTSLLPPEKLGAARSENDPEDVLTTVVTTNHSPFISFSTALVFSGTKDLTINLTVTAPSIFIGMQALKHLTTPRLLASTAQSLCPTADAEGN